MSNGAAETKPTPDSDTSHTCSYSETEEGCPGHPAGCAKSPDGEHCDHYWDELPCHYCGADGCRGPRLA